MPTQDTLLSIRDLTIQLPRGADRELAVEDINIDIKAGSTLCLVGESGSGKSMIANAILGLLPQPYVRPIAGSILFQGQDLLSLNMNQLRQIRGRKITMVFQDPLSALNPVMRIGEQLDEIYMAHRCTLTAAQRKQQIIQALQDVELPDPEYLFHSYPFRLSGGQRQRVLIAAALLLEPDLLVADEPTTALDVTTQAAILRLIEKLQQRRNTTVLFITHDFGVVAEIADYVVVMRHGKIVEQGPIQQVIHHPQARYTQDLLAAIPKGIPQAVTTASHRPVLLEVKSLSKQFRLSRGFLKGHQIVQALDKVSVNIHQGEVLGLVGVSGSCKSTLGRIIPGLTPADSGSCQLLMPEAKQQASQRRRSSAIQMVFQAPYSSLNPRHKVGRSLMAGLLADGVPRAQALQKIKNLLTWVGLPENATERYPHEFSGGQRQRIGIARALAVDPLLVVADEPVSALDVSVQAQVLELFARINEELQLAILFITHDLNVAAEMCHNIAVLRKGQLVEYGSTYQVLKEPQDDYTRALIDAIPTLTH